jgi:hypothetical protein
MRLIPPPGEEAALWVMWGLGFAATLLGAVMGIWGVWTLDRDRMAVAMATLSAGVGGLLWSSGLASPVRRQGQRPAPPSDSVESD